ncbi:MAG: hypothetical protein WC455_20645 [Dehalococcoidia bacterium]|jgi:hypothetical protein
MIRKILCLLGIHKYEHLRVNYHEDLGEPRDLSLGCSCGKLKQLRWKAISVNSLFPSEEMKIGFLRMHCRALEEIDES